MKIRSLLLVLALLAAPDAVSAQRSGRGDSDRDGPVETLLRRREHLDLSADQVARLEEIRGRVEERNRPMVARLLEIRREIRSEFGGSPRKLDRPRREEYERRVDAARPLLREIRRNHREAMKEVGGVLTRDQKERLRRLLRDDDDDRRKGERDGERRRGGGV